MAGDRHLRQPAGSASDISCATAAKRSACARADTRSPGRSLAIPGISAGTHPESQLTVTLPTWACSPGVTVNRIAICCVFASSDCRGATRRTVITVLLHELLDVRQRNLQAVAGKQAPQREFRRIYNLPGRGTRRCPFHSHLAYKVVRRRQERAHHPIVRRGLSLDPYVGKAPGVVKHMDALADPLAL